MFYKILVLGLVIFAQMFIIDYLFNIIPLKEDGNNYEFKKVVIDLSEVVLMVTLATFVIYMNVDELPEHNKIFMIIFICVIIILTWGVRNVSWVRDFLGDIDLKYVNLKIKPSNETRPINNEPNNVVFSKYVKKPSEMLNYSFSKLYNRHNNLPLQTDKVNSNKDYSMYNGYPENHICYGCGCLKRDNGYKFCGKELPGMGIIGCSSRWECRNCKNCESSNNNNSFNKKYGCDKCKCHNTNAGLICGTKSKLTGYIQKCNSSCAECDVCYGDSNSNSNVGYKTVNPSSNLKNVIININKVDIDNLFD